MTDRLSEYSSVYVVYDVKVQAFCLDVIARIPEGKFKGKMAIEATEAAKTMDTVVRICSWLLSEGARRDSLLIAVGGGITTDVAGFAASVYMRGISCAYVPTTLLAQVDAAVGGKTGVNLRDCKNIIGSFAQPVFVHSTSKPLQTLPKRQLLEGAAEMLKTFIIADPQSYRRAVKYFSRLHEGRAELGSNELEELVAEAVRIKKDIVAADFLDKGERHKLNLGHTFAHAIETISQGAISHGEAVAMGIIMAAELSEKEGVTEAGLAQTLKEDFSSCGLQTDCPYSVGELVPVMARDKKAVEGGVDFVLIRSIGKVETKTIEI